ncbi:hypothetical protein BJ878DRAFT_510953 [Calycina marina]|uniref:Uncharacterized protein n=1 Tax=Calycina marina TaxID=1763456 RepID=A0A9P7Z107_9HELO|nr:hypothetical protein BJ878DRAFT_510953 [Calycina marina]
MKNFELPLEENRAPGTTRPPLNDSVGCLYIIDHLDLVYLDIAVDTNDASELKMLVNKQPDRDWEMWCYYFDTCCHIPGSYEARLVEGIDRILWSYFLRSFRRYSAGKIDGLCCKLDGLEMVIFRRI